jgi:hypothetical protein
LGTAGGDGRPAAAASCGVGWSALELPTTLAATVPASRDFVDTRPDSAAPPSTPAAAATAQARRQPLRLPNSGPTCLTAQCEASMCERRWAPNWNTSLLNRHFTTLSRALKISPATIFASDARSLHGFSPPDHCPVACCSPRGWTGFVEVRLPPKWRTWMCVDRGESRYERPAGLAMHHRTYSSCELHGCSPGLG